MNIGQQLKKLRKSWDLNQKEFARRLPGQCDYTYIGKIERGHQYPSIKFLKKIAETYSVPLSYFFEDHPKATEGMVRSVDVLDWLRENEKEFERFAEKFQEEEIWLAYGVIKTLAEFTRRLKKELQNSVEEHRELCRLENVRPDWRECISRSKINVHKK